MSKVCMMYRPDLYSLQTGRLQTVNTGINLRWLEIRGIICRPELYNLQVRKTSEYIQTVHIEFSINSNTKSSQI